MRLVANHDRLILTGRCAASVDDADVCEGHTSCVDALKDAWTRIDAACREGEGRSEDESGADHGVHVPGLDIRG